MLEGLPDQLHLHARGIVIPHPEGGMLTVEAKLPPHMRETFAALGFEAPKPKRPSRGRAG
jgi:23S rRNA pseudouridine955/2504/2580 synthase